MNTRRVYGLTVRSRVGCNGTSCTAESRHIGIACHVQKDVVVEVARGPVQVDAQARVVGKVGRGKVTREIIRVLTQVGERQNVPHVLCVGLGIDRIHLNSRDPCTRVHHRQTFHGVVVGVAEVLRQEIVTVRLVVVCADVELLSLGSPFYFDFLTLSFLLAENRGVVNLAPLRLEFGSKQRLTSLYQRALQRHRDVARLDVLQDVVFFPLKTDVHLIFEIKRGLGIVVGSQVDFVSNAAIN